MRIAFISYEYPPDTACGGIATYVAQAARMLSNRGHEVEVFTSSPHCAGSESNGSLVVHRIQTDDRTRFPEPIALLFADRNDVERFDVRQGPDCMAEAASASALAPDVPLVVKLHTGMSLIQGILFSTLRFRTRVCKRLGAIRREECPIWTADHPSHAIGRRYALAADEVAAPSQAISRRCIRMWGLDQSRISCYPYPFQASAALLAIPADTNFRTVTFVGRLEMRKGVIDLADAIPLVLKRRADAKFRFVGAPLSSPEPGVDMRTFLQRRLAGYEASVRFDDAVSHDQVDHVYAASDVCVFPSLWESFGFVCLEAMAAARGVVATGNGGMAELLERGRCGRLVSPRNPGEIARAVVELLSDRALCAELGRRARERVVAQYHPDRIVKLQEQSYQRAIERHRSRTSVATPASSTS